MTVSVVVNNRDYARFLPAAIDSALAQTHDHVEVIVVDDGSTDGSRDVIASYGDRVRAVFKDNGGQASAFNAGFAACTGDVVIFLDADDALLEETAARVAAAFAPGVVKAHWPLWVIDADGRRTGEVKEPELPSGDLRDDVRRRGPSAALPSAPTSGCAWSRELLERVLPIPEADFRICADAYLFALAPALGRIAALDEPGALFRLHGANGYQARAQAEKVAIGKTQEHHQHAALDRLLREEGFEPDVGAWREHAWWHRMDRALGEVDAALPAQAPFILIDDDAWATDDTVAGRRRFAFVDRDGTYWGRPADDGEALRELQRLREAGAGHAVVAWPAFWWLEHYGALAERLRSDSRCLVDNERVAVFELS